MSEKPIKVLSIGLDFEGGIAVGALAVGKLINGMSTRGDITDDHAQDIMDEYTEIVTALLEGADAVS